MTPGPHLWSSMTQRSGRRAAMDFISLLVAKITSGEARRPPMSELRTIVRGRLFLESPRWRDGALWVADWGAHKALKIERRWSGLAWSRCHRRTRRDRRG